MESDLLVIMAVNLSAFKNGNCEVGSLAQKGHHWAGSTNGQQLHQICGMVWLEAPILVSPAS